MEGGFIGQQPTWSEHLRTGVWSLNDQLQRRKNNLWSPSQDPLASNVTLHLKCDSFPLTSENPANIISSNGTISVNQSIKKYGSASLSPTTSGSFVSISNPAFIIGSANFCWEVWAYPFTHSSGIVIGIGNHRIFANNTTQRWNWLVDNQLAYTFPIEYNNWVHLVLNRENANFRFFVNGIIMGTFNRSTGFNTNSIRISEAFNGCVDSIRVTKDTPRYTANFNPELDTYLSY